VFGISANVCNFASDSATTVRAAAASAIAGVLHSIRPAPLPVTDADVDRAIASGLGVTAKRVQLGLAVTSASAGTSGALHGGHSLATITASLASTDLGAAAQEAMRTAGGRRSPLVDAADATVSALSHLRAESRFDARSATGAAASMKASRNAIAICLRALARLCRDADVAVRCRSAVGMAVLARVSAQVDCMSCVGPDVLLQLAAPRAFTDPAPRCRAAFSMAVATTISSAIRCEEALAASVTNAEDSLRTVRLRAGGAAAASAEPGADGGSSAP